MSGFSGICALLIFGAGAAPDAASNQAFLGKSALGGDNSTLGEWNKTALELLSSSQGQDRDGSVCQVHEILDRGESASYWVYNKHHQKYLSTDGRNVDLYRQHGDHAVWHFTRASGTTTNTFYMVNDWAQKYMDSSGHNVHMWVSRNGLGDKGWIPENIKWHFFEADHLTRGADPCTFYLLHDGSHEWLDTHRGNVHVSPYLVNDVLDLQWQLIPARAGRR
ncbi:unnamed protein product [Polarella glacialis]|uniref:Uncharacterized protein n=1 Tax=Polarella glacialis TaxID=89957 RepID=A0A813IA47_POLGL|nr:unnamed protein product [Polarella glacialis]